MAATTEWRLHKFEPAIEDQYIAQQRERVVPIGRLGTAIGALSFLAYGAWDLLLDSHAWQTTWPIRLAVVAYFAITYVPFYVWRTSTNSRAWFGIALANYLVSSVGLALILARLPGGFVAGVSGFILGMIFIPIVVVRVEQAVAILIPLMVAPLVVMHFSGATGFEIANAAAWIAGGGGIAIGFSYLVDVINRRAFALERELAIEKQRSETLLLNILPASIASRLKASDATIADDFSSASVLFADIVGFTALSQRLSADQVVTLLNDLFSRFDVLVERHGVEKIKTIGDGYMVAAGVPVPRPDHAEAIARLALDMKASIAEFARERNLDMMLRIGVHSGSVVAGVIGKHKFAYDLWGDTVNLASRMESQGIPDEVQISAETRALLPASFVSEARGEIEIKGHASRVTHLLKGFAVA